MKAAVATYVCHRNLIVEPRLHLGEGERVEDALRRLWSRYIGESGRLRLPCEARPAAAMASSSVAPAVELLEARILTGVWWGITPASVCVGPQPVRAVLSSWSVRVTLRTTLDQPSLAAWLTLPALRVCALGAPSVGQPAPLSLTHLEWHDQAVVDSISQPS
jgi:hypothetical protein